MHAEDEDWGATRDKWFSTLISEIATDLNCKVILDYGAGKCGLSKSCPHWRIDNYDPGIPGLDSDPYPADLVVSRCVLEHVEPELIDDVLDHMALLTQKAALIVVSCFQSNLKLPDGRPVHLIVEPMEWWLKKLMPRWDINTAQLLPGPRFWFLGRTKDKAT